MVLALRHVDGRHGRRLTWLEAFLVMAACGQHDRKRREENQKTAHALLLKIIYRNDEAAHSRCLEKGAALRVSRTGVFAANSYSGTPEIRRRDPR